MNKNNVPRTESLPSVNNVTFKVGDGVHWGFNGDTRPGTVVAVSRSGREVTVVLDKFVIDEDDKGFKEGPRKGTFIQRPRNNLECPMNAVNSFDNVVNVVRRNQNV